ncbi:OmpA family protein [Mesorhizobium sp. AR10]|uniref:OmpA family protein n=1 Tax=Mesorhizobium sp. AR10 TaxID=2865839 RepID=UPI00215E3BAB|nr:OmpA family protein [Mesorhizobium sp. AR10]UVK41145.1 OmpA family protein [Mesorhizobium sp. AR10]
MKRQPRILAGTALGLLMASAPLGAYPLQGSAAFGPLQHTTAPLIPAQAACAEGESAEACAQKQQLEPAQKPEPEQQAAPAQGEQEQQPRKKKRDQQQQTEQAPAEQAAPAAEQPAEQAAPANEEQPIKPRKKKRDQQQQIEAAPAEQPVEQAAPANEEQPVKPRKKKRDQQQQIEAAPAEQPAEQAAPATEEQPVKPRKKRKQDQQIEAAPAEQAPTTKEAPAGEPVPQAEPLQGEQQAAPAQGEQPQDKKKRGKKPVIEQPVTGEQPATTGEQPSTAEQPANGQQPVTGEQPAQGENAAQGEAPADENAAPILDSQKDVLRKRKGKNGQQGGENANGEQANQPAEPNGEQAQAPKPAPVDQGPPPTDDKSAQQEIQPEKLVPVTEEKGKRVERAPDENVRDRRRPKGADVLKEIGDRVIIQFNNQTIVESNDGPRMNRGAKDVYYEDLPRGRIRETVVRENGNQIVTIRNRNGDVIQRSRITPDGREYVLSYVDERRYEDVDDWRDPGDDLPPMRLDIARRDYILDSEDVEDPDDYYTFLEQPPVEKVQRLYSIDEVKRSARVRDIARRVDLDTLNFEFGSASISDTEVQKLEGVAGAMEKLLAKNPAETFLIEGHTDAVGRPEANLALSDRRAESVAEALTSAFGIPPENLTTQGYGEEYLKVDTTAPNRENRRVGIRRITSLVAPVASAN